MSVQFINQLRFVVVKRSFALFPLAQKQFGDCRVYPCAYKLLAKSNKSNAIKSVQFRTHKTCSSQWLAIETRRYQQRNSIAPLRSVLRKGYILREAERNFAPFIHACVKACACTDLDSYTLNPFILNLNGC